MAPRPRAQEWRRSCLDEFEFRFDRRHAADRGELFVDLLVLAGKDRAAYEREITGGDEGGLVRGRRQPARRSTAA